jgi:drug/metabolite transporter (DMT)-like permease
VPRCPSPAYAAYIPLLHRMRGPLDAAVASAWVISGAAIVFCAWALWSGVLVTAMTAPMWAIAVGAAVISTTVAFITFLRGLEALGAVRTAILSTVEPFWTALLAALVLGQSIGRTTLAGGFLIIVAIALLQRSAHPAIPDAPPPE